MTTLLAAVALLTPSHSPASEPPTVALLYSDHGDFRHRDDYDARLRGLGWPTTKFENTQLADLAGGLGDFDLILGTALFNFSNAADFAEHRAELLNFVREGGALVLTDCNYTQHLQ